MSPSPSAAQRAFVACYASALQEAREGYRFDDASDHVRARSSYQQAIESSGLCVDSASNAAERAEGSLLRAYARLGFVGELQTAGADGDGIKAGHLQDDISAQLRSAWVDLTEACGDFAALQRNKSVLIKMISRYNDAHTQLYHDVGVYLATPFPLPSPLNAASACQSLKHM
jgi:hypothetical protein